MVIYTEDFFKTTEITAENIHKFIVIPKRDDLDAPPELVSLERFSTLVSSKEQEDSNLSSCKLPFVWKLYEMLDDVEREGNEHIVSWIEDGTAFRVHKLKEFVNDIIPSYFKQSKYKSFQRQLNFYQFTRITSGPNTGAYKHPKFLKSQKSLCLTMTPKSKRRTTSMSAVTSTVPKQKTMVSTARTEEEGAATGYVLPTQLQRGPSQVISHTSTPPGPLPLQTISTAETPAMTNPPIRRVSANEDEIVYSTCQQQEEHFVLKSEDRKEHIPDNGELMDVFGGMRFHFVDTIF